MVVVAYMTVDVVRVESTQLFVNVSIFLQVSKDVTSLIAKFLNSPSTFRNSYRMTRMLLIVQPIKVSLFLVSPLH